MDNIWVIHNVLQLHGDENNTEILLNFNKVSTKATIGVLENTTLPKVY